MREFVQRCEALLELLAQPSPYWSAAAAEQYRSLKRDLEAAARYGTVSGRRGLQSRCEVIAYLPGVRHARNELRPPATAKPTDKWFPRRVLCAA